MCEETVKLFVVLDYVVTAELVTVEMMSLIHLQRFSA